MAELDKTVARGYGYRHRKLRDHLKPTVQAGKATCWRCTNPINPNEEWDLGHDDNDRTKYRGPEHVACNRSTNGRQQRETTVDQSRNW